MNQPSKDKRRADRVTASLYVQYLVHTSDGKKNWDITNRQDISAVGISIMTSKKIDRHARVDLRIKFPTQSDMIEMSGVVIDSAPKGISFMTRIDFRDIIPANREYIREYILRALKEKDGK